jgi:predicted amidohydrolase
MLPSAAPSWPVAAKDEIDTSSAALFQTPARDAFTLDAHSKARISAIENGRPYIYVRQGGVQFNARSGSVYVCIADRLYVPAKSAQGSLRLDATGSVVRHLDAGAFADQATRTCGAEVPVNFLSGLPAAAGGSIGAAAAGVSTSAVIVATAASVAGVAAAGVSSAFAASAASAPCSGSSGCNFNPVSISPSQP